MYKCVKWWMEWGCGGWWWVVCAVVCVELDGVVVGSACMQVCKVVVGWCGGEWWWVVCMCVGVNGVVVGSACVQVCKVVDGLGWSWVVVGSVCRVGWSSGG